MSNRYWQREFGGESGAIGKTLRIRGQEFTVVGVLDDGFTGMVPMLAPEIWLPVRFAEEVEPAGINESVPSPTGSTRLDRRGQRWLFVKARLTPGTSVEQARANLDVVAARLRAEHPQTNKDRRITVRPTADTRLHPEADRMLAWIVTGTMLAVALVLVIACANVAGMLLARAAARQREIAIRLAVGAGRGRLVRQLLTESVILGVLGAGVGLVLASWLTRLLTSFDLPIPDRAVARSPAGCARPRLHGWRRAPHRHPRRPRTGTARDSRQPGLGSEGRHGRRRGQAGGAGRARDVLVVGQIAVTIVLLVTAGLLVRSLLAASKADVGFPTDGLAIVSADTGMLRYTPERSQQVLERSHAADRSDPWRAARRARVAAAVLAQLQPLEHRGPWTPEGRRRDGHINQQRDGLAGVLRNTRHRRAPGTRVRRIGRRPSDRRVAIVNELFARTYWPGDSAIGRIVYERTLSSGRAFEIVGVVANHTLQTVGETRATGDLLFQRPSARAATTSSSRERPTNDAALVSRMRETLLGLEPDLLLMESQTMKAQMQGMLFPVRVAAALVTAFSALGLALAAVGLYGIIAFSVAQRTREIGIRMAVGARPGTVVRLVLRQGLALVAVGLVVGALLGALATRIVAGALYGVSVADPMAWGAAAAVLLGAAMLANAVPAYRAVRIDPVKALRNG